MPTWVETVDVRGLLHNEDLSFEESRDRIVRQVKASRWYKNRDAAGFDEFGEAVDGLAAAEDVAAFDEWWSQIYDLADYDRVWIATF